MEPEEGLPRAPLATANRPTEELVVSRSPHSILVQACIILMIGVATVAMVPGLLRLQTLDYAYCVIVEVAIGVSVVMTQAIARLHRTTANAALGLLASDLVLKAVHLALLGRFPDVYVLGTMAFVFPTTPLLLGLIFRRWKAAEDPAGEFTTGQLLRNKQQRDLAREGKGVGTRRAG